MNKLYIFPGITFQVPRRVIHCDGTSSRGMNPRYKVETLICWLSCSRDDLAKLIRSVRKVNGFGMPCGKAVAS